ncbi:hypothetical protein LAZ67_19002599 [Cordylochernes scorpioides]|uniref:Transposase n=1 Tax=Cordylochernes scorpioides TaxID=51811 RepID=A0ABY6LIM5_9ARAC|nr:hypothetical protein LAZ67_19002599 [Cordylochernes scorpioides]
MRRQKTSFTLSCNKWVHYDNPKRRAMYGYPGRASSSTVKPNIHGDKIMLCIWWDQLEVVYYELVQRNESMTGEVCRRQLMCLSRALREKRLQYANRHDKVIFQHDNARPHAAACFETYLEMLKWEVLPHPPYSSDIASFDYYLFRSMQHGLADQQFSNYDEVKKWNDEWIAAKERAFFHDGIRQLPER